MGKPYENHKNAWFIREKILWKRMMNRGTPISGNLYFVSVNEPWLVNVSKRMPSSNFR